MLNILPGRLQTNLVVPVDHQNCRVVFEYFYDDVESEAARRKIDEDIEFSERIQDEDIGICEQVQRGLRSRRYDRYMTTAETRSPARRERNETTGDEGTMQTQISTRGTELTGELESRIAEVAAGLSAKTTALELAKFVVEERETGKAVGVVLSWGEKKDTVVRHAEAGDWERAFMDLERRLERALEESAGDAP